MEVKLAGSIKVSLRAHLQSKEFPAKADIAIKVSKNVLMELSSMLSNHIQIGDSRYARKFIIGGFYPNRHILHLTIHFYELNTSLSIILKDGKHSY